MRKTKIICTIGPASDNEETLTKMCQAGMNVARLNFSHGTHEEHQKKIDLVRRVREKLGLPIAILLDTKGPEYRIKTFKEGKVTLISGNEFIFTANEIEGDKQRVSVNYKNLANDLNKNDIVLLNNGLVKLEVISTTETDVVCKVLIGGEISDRKSMSFPGKTLKQKYLSEQDKEDILFGINNGIDFIACSFVSCRQDLIDVKDFLKENGVEGIGIIAKMLIPFPRHLFISSSLNTRELKFILVRTIPFGLPVVPPLCNIAAVSSPVPVSLITS